MLLAEPPTSAREPLIVRATERAIAGVESVVAARPRAMVEYQGRSRAFMHEVLGFRPWSDLARDLLPELPTYELATQVDVLDAVDDPSVHEIVVRSGKGPGKTQLFAACIEYEAECFEDTIFITLAPTFRQVREQVWRNVAALREGARRPLNGRLLDTRLDIAPKWFALGLSTTKPEKLAGFHGSSAISEKYRDRPDLWDKISDEEYFELVLEEIGQQRARVKHRGGRVVVGVDESSGIDDRLEPAIDGLLTNLGSRLYRFGNPTRTTGRFFMCFHGDRTPEQQATGETVDAPAQRCFTIDARTAPAAIVDRAHLQRMARLCGPNPEKNPTYQVEVMGLHPTSSEDNVFPYSLLESASRSNPLVGGLHMGVDVARHGGDKCVAYLFDRGHICGVHRWADKGSTAPDTIASAAIIEACAAEWQVRPEHVHVDVTGNWGIYDVLWARKFPCDGVNFGAGAEGEWAPVLGRGPFLRNRRQELHWVALRLLQEGLLTIPSTPTYAPLWADLTQILKKKTGVRSDEWAVEVKIDFKKRVGRSCDDSDSMICCLSRTLANRVRFSTLQRKGNR